MGTKAKKRKESLEQRLGSENLEKILGYKNEFGTAVYTISLLTGMTEKGYTANDIITLAELKDTDGSAFFSSSYEIKELSCYKWDLEDIVELAEITDSEGKSVFRKTPWDMISGMEAIGKMLVIGAKPNTVENLVGIKGADNESVFRNFNSIFTFILAGGTPEYAQSLAELRTHEENQIFNDMDIAYYKQQGGTISYAKNLSALKDTLGQTIFSKGRDIHNFHISKYTLNDAKKMSDLLDTDGQTVFRDGGDISSFLDSGGTIEDAQDYISIIDRCGSTYFNGYEIALLKHNGVSCEFASDMAKKYLNAETIMYNHLFGINEEESPEKNASRPNALVFYPASDPTIKAFTNEDSVKFFKTLMSHYRLRLRAVSTIDEIWEEEKHIPGTDLLIIGGHGSKHSIQLGESRPKYGILLTDYESEISTNTIRLEDLLGNLPDEAVIFLDSCMNGRGGEYSDNLANHIARCAPGRTVISSKTTFYSGDINIKNICPLSLEIHSLSGQQDTTYVSKHIPYTTP